MQTPVSLVSLGAIRSNLRALRRMAGRPVIAVVKDDAYGHGAERVAHAIADMVCLFAVATVDEGARLRTAGVGHGILVLTPPLCGEEAARGAAYGLTLTAASFETLALCRGRRVHLAVNTGMNRYGFSPDAVAAACRAARAEGVQVEGVFSHLYAPADGAAVAAQTRAFAACAGAVRSLFPAALCHLCATGGILAGGKAFDAVRPGIGLYGYAPDGRREGLTPALRVVARVGQRTRPFGEGVGYARATRHYAALHTLCAGYGSGLVRSGGVGNIGNLCMDACVCEGDRPFAEEVCLIQDAAKYAAERGTTAYEVLVALGRGTERRYV